MKSKSAFISQVTKALEKLKDTLLELFKQGYWSINITEKISTVKK